jgi:hypothetical protein
MSGAEMAGHLLADNNAPDSRGDHGRPLALNFRVKRAKFIGKFPADLGSNGSVLQKECALEELTAMKSGTENEVSMEQSSGFFEESKNVAHWERGLRMKAIKFRVVR